MEELKLERWLEFLRQKHEDREVKADMWWMGGMYPR